MNNIHDVKFILLPESAKIEKQQVNIRLRTELIEKLKLQNAKYQTLINMILETYLYNYEKLQKN